MELQDSTRESFKRCSKCLELLPVACFNPAGKYGLLAKRYQSWCKNCKRNNRTTSKTSAELRRKYHRDRAKLLSRSYIAVLLKIPTAQVTDEMYEEKARRVAEVRRKRHEGKALLLQGSKRCSSCNKVKKLEDFNIDSSKVHAKSGWCKTCHCLYTKLKSDKWLRSHLNVLEYAGLHGDNNDGIRTC